MAEPLRKEFEQENINYLRLVKNENKSSGKDLNLYYNSGYFPIMLIIIFFLCVGVIINIGLRIQNINYDKNIYSISQIISSEKERQDRLELEISQLKSPLRITGFMVEDLNNQEVLNQEEAAEITSESISGEGGEKTLSESISGKADFKKLDILYSRTANDFSVSETNRENSSIKDSFGAASVISNIKDVLMVVSEGILTFFIP